MAKPQDYEGIMCPNPDCPAEAGGFKTGQSKKTKDVVDRKHTCKTCGSTFRTVQVLSTVLEIKNNQLSAT